MKKIFLAATVFLSAMAVKAQNFIPTDEGSKIHFVIKNFGINTGGDLAGVKGTIKFDAKKPATSAMDVTVDVSTIDTDNDKRDNHLRSEDFFDVAQYPTIRIVSTGITKGADLKHFNFKGKLTIKNVTKDISFPFTAEGKNGAAVFTGQFEINRIDFGVGKESATMSDKVKVSLTVYAKPA